MKGVVVIKQSRNVTITWSVVQDEKDRQRL